MAADPYLPVALRTFIALRAGERCEYSLYPQIGLTAHEVEHIIAKKHGGLTTESNLALACRTCNVHKGTDIAPLDPQTGVLTPFFNPRMERWRDHFRLDAGEIFPLSDRGRATAQILRFNLPERIVERQLLILVGLYDLFGESTG